tara:strand:+ start:1719 stop:3749 length:2031 start_codon:yes stop_codon:yes gene_type:complete
MALSQEEKAEYEALRLSTGAGTLSPTIAQQAEQQAQATAKPPSALTTTEMLDKYVIDPLTGRRLGENFIAALPDIGESTFEVAGMVEGARRGATVPGGVAVKATTAAIGGVVGAFLGTGFGENLRQLFSNESDPLKVIDKAIESGMFASAGEIFTAFSLAKQGITKIRSGKATGEVGDGVTNEELNAISELQAGLESVGITLTPAQLTNSTLQQTLEKVAISGFGGANKFEALYTAQENFIKDTLDKSIKQIGNPDRKLTGEMFQDALEKAEDDLIKWAQPKYAALDKKARNVNLSIQSTEQTLKNIKAKNRLHRRKGTSSRLDPEIETMYNDVLGNTRNMSFESLFSTISKLKKEQRRVSGRIENKNPDLEKAYRDTIESLLNDAEKAVAKSGDSTVMDLYKEVTDVYGESLRTLYDSALTSVVSKQPEFVGEQLFKNGNVSSVEAAFKALDEAAKNAKRVGEDFDVEEIKNSIRAGYLKKLFVKTQVDDTSTETAARLLKQIKEDPNYKDTFNAVLSPKMQGQVLRVLAWSDKLQSQSAGNFSLIVRGRQSGAFNQAISEVGGAGAGGGFKPLILATAASLVASPLFLANRAVNGKITGKKLAEMKNFAIQYDRGELTPANIISFFTLLANDSSEEENLPPEFKIPGLNSKESIELHLLRAERARDNENIEETN